MGRTLAFRNLKRAAQIAKIADELRITTPEAIERAREATARKASFGHPSRRAVLQGATAAGVVGMMGLPRLAWSRPVSRTTARIAIVGGGMGGLSAAYALYNKGVVADVFEANTRVGGRVWSLGGAFSGPTTFPGQVVERGGELIDTLHTTMRGYCNEFGLAVEDYDKSPGEALFFSGDELWDEADVVDEYRAFVAAMRADLQNVSEPTAMSFTDAEVALDITSLDEYLDSRGAGSLLRNIIEAAYVGEYGRELSQQSALNMLLFLHADKSSNFREFGVYSDERFHIVGGNEQIPAAIGNVLQDQIQLGMKLLHVAKDSQGAYSLTFEDTAGGQSTLTYDYVVLAIPFSVLRDVSFDASVALPSWKKEAIASFDYGTNTKMMVGFQGRPWADAGTNGAVYAHGLAAMHNVWETNYSQAASTRGVLTNYTGGDRGTAIDLSDVQGDVQAFLADLDQVLPGVSSQVRRDETGAIVAHVEKWSASPFTKGSYSNNFPGYFTSICGLEGLPVERLYFAGEHADSFYEWQGFMEGAANSGIAAATNILAELRVS